MGGLDAAGLGQYPAFVIRFVIGGESLALAPHRAVVTSPWSVGRLPRQAGCDPRLRSARFIGCNVMGSWACPTGWFLLPAGEKRCAVALAVTAAGGPGVFIVNARAQSRVLEHGLSQH